MSDGIENSQKEAIVTKFKSHAILKKNFYNNKKLLETNSIDLIAAQDLKLKSLIKSFDDIVKENNVKNYTKQSIYAEQLKNKFLKADKVDLDSKNKSNIKINGPAFVVKQEAILMRQNILKPKKNPIRTSRKEFKQNLKSDQMLSKRTNNNLISNGIQKSSENLDENNLNENNLNDQNELSSSKLSENKSELALTGDELISKNVGLNENENEKSDETSKTKTLEDESSTKENESIIIKSFIDKFFDRELTSNDNYELLEDSKLNEINENNQVNLDEDEILHADLNEFLDKIFNYKSEKKLKNASKTSLKDVKPNLTNIDEKLKYLTNIKFQDKSSSQSITNYIKAYECLNDPRVKYFIDKRFQDNCECIKNCLNCCIKNYFMKNKDDKSIITKCCNLCKNFNNSDKQENSNRFNQLKEFALRLELDYLTDTLQASSLIEDNIILLNNLNKCNCASSENKLKCCIESIYGFCENYQDNIPEKLDDNFLEFKCCLNCDFVSTNQKNFLKETEIQKISNNPKDEKNFFLRKSYDSNEESEDEHQSYKINCSVTTNCSKRKKSIQESIELFFGENSLIEEIENEGEVKDIEHKENEDEESTIKSKLDENSINQFYNKTIDDKKETVESNHIEKYPLPEISNAITPRKAAIKKPSIQTQKSIKDSNRKSVTFFEDPKYGFQVVEIPDWLENLRTPVYSKKYHKTLTEWKK